MNEQQPWSVYETKRGRAFVRRWQGNGGIVGIFITKEAAREFARGMNRDREERVAGSSVGIRDGEAARAAER